MTPAEAVLNAQALCSDYTEQFPASDKAAFLRLDTHQHHLFGDASAWDPEHFGADEALDVQTGQVLLPRTVARVSDVYVEDPGCSKWKAGRRVNIVPANDYHRHMAPRVFIRSLRLVGVEQDIVDVQSVRVYFARYPAKIGLDGTIGGHEDADMDLPEPWTNLLVIDLARDLIRRAIALEGDMKTRALDRLDEQYETEFKKFEKHVVRYTHVRQDRFRRPQGDDPHDILITRPQVEVLADG